MADSPIERQVARLRTTYAQSGLKRFLTWWGRELKPLVPARVRQWFVERREEVRVRADAGSLVLRHASTPLAEPTRIPLTEEATAQRAVIEHELDRTEERPTLVYLIPAQRVLRRSITLPLAAEENLRQVLTFEMDRQTPFRADQVYFDHRIVRRDLANKQLFVDVAIVPRGVADAELATLAPTGLVPDVLDAADGEVNRLGFNLLPPEARASRPNVWLRIDAALALAVLGLLVLAMVQSLKNREAALEALRAETQQMSREAKDVALRRTELTDAITGANFLVEKKKSRPPVVDILLDVTRRLPDDTWLQRFSVNADQVQLQGQAREASALIATLQKSPVLKSPALQGAITPDARTGKEQFLIAATAQVPPATAKPSAPAPAASPPTAPGTAAPATPATAAPDTTTNAAPAAEKTDASPAQR